MFKLLFATAAALAVSNAQLIDSPCPKIFQYGFLDEQPIGIIRILVPVEYGENFFTIVEMLPKSKNYTDPAIIPTVDVLDKEFPDRVLRGVYDRQLTTFIVKFNEKAPLFKYRIKRIWLNEDVACEAADSKYTLLGRMIAYNKFKFFVANFIESGPNSLMLRIAGHFQAPPEVAEYVRKDYPDLQTDAERVFSLNKIAEN